MDHLLYVVRWDDGVTSKHYANELFCIGRFQSKKDFEAAIKPTGEVELTLGPGGGFRRARLDLDYDGKVQTAILSREHERLWREVVEPLVRTRGLRVVTKKLRRGERS
jgi:hypothetical protein